MRQIRIEPVTKSVLLVSIVCECGLSVIDNVEAPTDRFRHEVTIGNGRIVNLVCRCGKRYSIVPQNTHCHVHES